VVETGCDGGNEEGMRGKEGVSEGGEWGYQGVKNNYGYLSLEKKRWWWRCGDFRGMQLGDLQRDRELVEDTGLCSSLLFRFQWVIKQRSDQLVCFTRVVGAVYWIRVEESWGERRGCSPTMLAGR